MQLVAADIGGTHARFAIATRNNSGHIELSHEARLKVADHASLQAAFEAFRAGLRQPMPRVAGVAVAAPVEGALLKLTNNPWTIQPAVTAERLGLDRVVLVNDFAAVAHAVAVSRRADFAHLFGPDTGLPAHGPVSIIGPGTGLGVASLLKGEPSRVIATEGGHIDFAPLDNFEDSVLARLRAQYRRVSVERIVSGPGLATLHAAMAAIEGRAAPSRDDKSLWHDAIAGEDTLLQAALDRWMLALGSVCGDLVLAQGGLALVLAGGLLSRLAHRLPTSGFHARFTAKGRFEARMAAIPIVRITCPEPGLLGAAAACFAEEPA